MFRPTRRSSQTGVFETKTAAGSSLSQQTGKSVFNNLTLPNGKTIRTMDEGAFRAALVESGNKKAG